MNRLLPLQIGSFIELNEVDAIENHLFVCTDVKPYYNQYNYQSFRYMLKSHINEEEYILDVSKCYNKDIKIVCVKEIEELDFDQNFLSLVGTSPLGYNHPDIQNIDFVLYNIEVNPLNYSEDIKYVVLEDELPKNPKEHGYMQDGNGNWYFLAKKDCGFLLEFEEDFKRVWEYKQDENERLIIEIEALKSSWDYIKEKPPIKIYSGKRLARSDIKLNVTKRVKNYDLV